MLAVLVGRLTPDGRRAIAALASPVVRPSSVHRGVTRGVSVILVLVACGGERRSTRAVRNIASDTLPARARTLVIAEVAEPRTLLPPFAIDLVAGQVCDLVYQRLAVPVAGFSTVGDRDYRPQLATAWRWAADSLSIRFMLDPRARWHDGVSVTSRDVRLTFDIMRDSSTGSPRPSLADIVDSVTTPDIHTVIVWARRRTASLFHQITFATYVLPSHHLEGVPRAELIRDPVNRAPIGSGPFRVIDWRPGEQIDLAAVDGATPRPARVVLRFMPNGWAAANALLGGAADVLDAVSPEDVRRLDRSPDVAVLHQPGQGYAVLQFNLHALTRGAPPGAGPTRPPAPHPIFGEVAVRRALAVSIDRRALVTNLLGPFGHVSIGPVTRAQVTADPALPLPAYNPDAARRLFDAAGWRVPLTSADGIRRRGNTQLRFTLRVPTSSATRVRAAVLIQQMLAQVGVAVEIEAGDNASVVAALREGRFDAALMAFRVDPDPTSVAAVWGGAAARQHTGFNYGGYASAVTDALLDSAARATDRDAERQRYQRAYARIVDDVPAVFLYEPDAVVAYRRIWRPHGVRADAWWAGLADWRRVP